MKNNIQHKEVSENITSSPIYPHSIPLENEMQLLHNLQPCCQPVSNVENANSLVQESYHIQELGNTVSIEPLQKVIPSHQIQLENNAPIAREKNEISQVIEILRDLQHKMQRTNERLNTIERKIDCNVINTIPTKPRILPFSTIEAIQMFTKDNAVYEEVVQYFKFLNCITLKDSVHQCIKEALTMQVAGQMTWWGINDIKFPFDNTILCQAIYQAVASNRYYPKPTREEFQKNIVASLKIAKQRFRNARGRHPGIQGNRRNLQATADALYNDDNDGDNRNSENDDNDRDNRNSENEHNVTDVENDSDENEHSSNDS
nr:PREDICTED: uncharacterized protein LOC105677028 [Linepithema humile]